MSFEEGAFADPKLANTAVQKPVLYPDRSTTQGELYLDVSGLYEPILPLDVATPKEPLLLLDVSTQRPVQQLRCVYTTGA